MEGEWHWEDIFKVLKEKHCQIRILTVEKLFKNKGEIKISPDKQKLKEFIPSITNLLKMLKEVHQTENEGH